jgi:hypothetical protein
MSLNLLNTHVIKAKNVLKACAQVKQQYDIDVYDIFKIFLSDREDILYDNSCCHAVITTTKNCVTKHKQCSKARFDEKGKKQPFYCKLHIDMSETGKLEPFIVSEEVVNTLNKSNFEPTDIAKMEKIVLDSEESTVALRPYEHNNKFYFVDQTTCEVFNIDMEKLGLYMYDSDKNKHLCFDKTVIDGKQKNRLP